MQTDMQNDSERIVQLLTEIRDDQREEIACRKRAMEESVRLQRSAVRWQRGGLLFAALLLVGLFTALGLLLVAAKRKLPQDLPPTTVFYVPLLPQGIAES